jgi:mono/diheme cytochrome c family protein
MLSAVLKYRRQRLASGAGAAAVVAVAATVVLWQPWRTQDAADADNPRLVAAGRTVYAEHCASCHGKNLEGQPRWRERLPNGRLPAPPHDASGHTWHHPDRQLFEITKNGVTGMVPGYQSDMPAFASSLSDEQIWAVLAFIKSGWPEDIRQRQERLNRNAK